DLVVMIGSLHHLRHSRNAVAQYLVDHLPTTASDELVLSRHLDLWQLTEAEINQTLGFIDAIISRTAGMTSREEPFATELAAPQLQRLAMDAFAHATCPDGDDLPVIRVAQESAEVMFKQLALAAGTPSDGVALRALAADGA